MYNTTNSKQLYEKAIRMMPGGVSSPVRAFKPHPFFVKRGVGSHIWDVDDNEYLDYCMSYGALLLGHTNEEIIRRVTEQLNQGTMFGCPTPLESQLVELIIEAFPGIEMGRLVNSGSEATLSAIRLARGYTGREHILKFEGCYHGAHDAVLVKAGSGAITFGVPTSLGIPKSLSEKTIVTPFNDLDAVEETMTKKGEDVAAIIVEPVVGNSGVLLPQNDFLNHLRKLCDEHGTLLIFDEIITGFRVANGGAQELYGIKPDLTTLGKIIGHGFCVGAYGGRKDIMEMISPAGKIFPSESLSSDRAGTVYQAGTFSGNPISVTAGIVALEYIKNNPHVYNDLNDSTKQLVSGLKDLAEDRGLEIVANQCGSMYQIFFGINEVVDHTSLEKANVSRFQDYYLNMHKQGVFIPPGNAESNFLSTQHSNEDIQATLEAASKVFPLL